MNIIKKSFIILTFSTCINMYADIDLFLLELENNQSKKLISIADQIKQLSNQKYNMDLIQTLSQTILTGDSIIAPQDIVDLINKKTQYKEEETQSNQQKQVQPKKNLGTWLKNYSYEKEKRESLKYLEMNRILQEREARQIYNNKK